MQAYEAIRKRIWEISDVVQMPVSRLLTEAGLSKNWIGTVGHGVSPSVASILKICRYVGISLHDFFNTDYFYNLEELK